TEEGEVANAVVLVEKSKEDVVEEDDDPRSRAARRLVESILFGDDAVSDEGGKDDDLRLTDCDDHARRRAGAEMAEKEAAVRFRSNADALHEIIGMLIHSESFGRPGAVSTPDADGRLPLHLLLGAGVQLSDPDRDATCRGAGRIRTEGAVLPSVVDPLRLLIDACPASLEVRDGLTGLLPFMLAAASSPSLGEHPGDDDDDDDDEDAVHVETVYRLLRAAPNAI
ncbi:hypothetical protein THAOC_14148, partial [Thalassiosira oceanica]